MIQRRAFVAARAAIGDRGAGGRQHGVHLGPGDLRGLSSHHEYDHLRAAGQVRPLQSRDRR